MVGNNENILVEFDYNNITIVDPNKVIDYDGKVKERFVNQEDLVFYANLECKVLPRTKLAVGVATNDQIQTVSIATINFLKPGGKTFLDNSYTDEITGRESIKGNAVNQPKQTAISSTNKDEDYFIRQTINSGGKPGATDNGLLGITSIQVRQGLDFMPTVNVQLEDVKGRALFEAGDNSPYAAFFNLPYPMFSLTLKGYYGKAVKLSLMLQSFNSRFDTHSGNFKIDLKFYTYKYTILSEISMAALSATPHMYKSRIKIATTQGSANSTTVRVQDKEVTRGFEKIKEVYSEYKSKGLIPDDFPEITLLQMHDRLENFIKNVLDSFAKQNLSPLSDLDKYQTTLNEYSGDVFYYKEKSWYNKFMDPTASFVLKNGLRVFAFKKEYNLQKRADAKAELDSLLKKYNELLNTNETVGSNGKYSINNKTTKISIPNSIKYDTFLLSPPFTLDDVDLKSTYKLVKNTKIDPTQTDLDAFANELKINNTATTTLVKDENGNIEPIKDYYFFEGKNSFIDKIDKMGKDLKVFREQIQDDLTKALADLLQSKDSEIGFVPNIRNVLAVVFATGEAFLRLMDDVHTKAWDQRDSKIRRNAIINPNTQGASQDNIDSGNNDDLPIYPWPQMIKETAGTDGHEKFEIVYPGDSSVISQTKGYLPDEWPEIEFVEEFIRGVAEKAPTTNEKTAENNELTEPQRVSLNAIEFPITNEVFGNKEEVKYFYELYERVLSTVFYSRLIRSNNFISDSDKVSNIIADGESINVIKSLGSDNPFLIKKLKEYAYNGNNFEVVLRHYSNQGTGESWQNFIRGIFNTRYIKNDVNNSSFEFLNNDIIQDSLSQPIVSLPTEADFTEYVSGSTTSNTFDIADTYPFTNKDWDKKYLANGTTILDEKGTFDTRKILTYIPANKIISNLDAYSAGRKPLSNFLSEVTTAPTGYDINADSMKSFYTQRINDYKSQLYTEGNLKYNNYSGGVNSEQTVSILNTPYFINSIQDGVKKFRDNDTNPYVASAYLFINSLPLATLREKYKTTNESDDLNYLFATFKKFGAIHKVPYAWILKYGSIWHRYKEFVNTGVDIIDTSWSGFSYVNNFDPVTNSPSKMYTFSAGTELGIVDIVLQNTITVGAYPSTTINTGFYPKMINDFNVFLQGYEIFTGYTSTAIEEGFKSGFTLNYVNNAIISKEDGFDPNSPNRDLRIFPWSIYINAMDNSGSYIIPSQGAPINQTLYECFDKVTGQLKIEVNNNQAMYDGSVRGFWSAPNYGYFDSNDVVKPNPTKYLKEIFSGKSQQENFSINGVQSKYSDVSEMFSVFEKDVLDLFEAEFLEFSKSKYDYSPSLVFPTDTETKKMFRNFQLTMTELFKIPKVTGDTSEDRVRFVREAQLKNITEKLKSFVNDNDVIFKYGNPSNFDKKLFYTFSNFNITDPYTWGKYSLDTPNALPVSGGTVTLTQSKTNYPNEWKALETYVGYSEIPELVYKNSGSYITDFFIDMNINFSVDNVVNFAPIIKIYATQKLIDNTINYNKFITLMDGYLETQVDFKNKIFDSLIIKIQKGLPNVSDVPGGKIESVLEGNQTKVELWESFKAINDKWISGADFKTKTLFEDVLMLDRASRNVGDKILVDIFKLKNRLININPKSTMQNFIQSILVENNFVVMNLPSYVNFYNVQDASKNPTPRSEGTIEFANTLFGTYLNVDYRDSSAKMVCFYGGKPSEQLDLKNNVDYRYRNDAFELRRASDNPLVEELTNKKDWDKSNKVVGFNVDIGTQNQSIFYGFSVSQDAGLATAESLEVLNQMANQGGNRQGTTQSNSLYNLYKNRSYKCNISMMGNALIQPTMYFNLRHVPMFSGPYMIQSVNHSITPGSFETNIDGIRQPTASLPKIDNYLQTLKTNLLQSIIEKDKQDKRQKEQEVKLQQDVISQANNVNSSSTNKDSTTHNSSITTQCQPQKSYVTWSAVQSVITKTETYKSMKSYIVNSAPNNLKLQHTIFATMYLATGNGNGFTSNEFNFAGISIDQSQPSGWGQAANQNFVDGYYYCSKSNTAYPAFKDTSSSVNMLVQRWSQRVGSIQTDTAKDIAKFWVINANSPIQRNDDVYNKLSDTEKTNIESNVQKAIDVFNSIP
jgi:hypothetical protein